MKLYKNARLLDLITCCDTIAIWVSKMRLSNLLYLILQQKKKKQICDAVAVAKILNATLVVPHLEVNPVWQDSRYIVSMLTWNLFYNLLFLSKVEPLI